MTGVSHDFRHGAPKQAYWMKSSNLVEGSEQNMVNHLRELHLACVQCTHGQALTRPCIKKAACVNS